jgi:hypothetical protein
MEIVAVKKGEVGKVGTAWFSALNDGEGVWLCGNASSFKRTPREVMPDNPYAAGLWLLGSVEPVPPDEWPPRVCAAVAREMLTQ